MSTSLLGFGFNIFGRMALSEGVTESVVSTTDDNIVISPPDQPTVHNSHVADSREQVTEQLSASVGLEYSSIAFDAEFSAKYDQESESDSQVMYGMYEVLHPLSTTRLLSTDTNQLSPTFGSDPDVVGLPDVFDPTIPEQVEQFFRVFRRYGTHFVSEITMGGKLSAYTTAKITKDFDSTKATADMKAEYEALFGSASVSASTEWAKVDTTWGADRNVYFETIGGNADALSSFVPDYNASAGDQVTAWLGSVKDTPGIIGYQLAELSKLFVGATALAVHKALDAYLSSLIRVSTWQLYQPATKAGNVPQYASTISVPGQVVLTEPTSFVGPEPTSATEVRWAWIVLMDPDKLDAANPVLSKAFYFNGDTFKADVDSAIIEARGKVKDPLVLLCGELDAYQTAETPVGVVIPTQLQQLIEECGFDLQGQLDNGGYSPHHLISLVGLAHSSNPCVVTTESADSIIGTPARTVVQYVDDVITVVDQSGSPMSPVAS